MVTLDRGSWSAVVNSFEQFFVGLGQVTATEDAVSFSGAPRVDTALELRRDGRWESVTFDRDAHEVVITDGTSSYRYRVPPALLSDVAG